MKPNPKFNLGLATLLGLSLLFPTLLEAANRITSISTLQITVSTPAGERRYRVTKETLCLANGTKVTSENLTAGMEVAVIAKPDSADVAAEIRAIGAPVRMNTDEVVFNSQPQHQRAKKKEKKDDFKILSGSENRVISTGVGSITISGEKGPRSYRTTKETKILVNNSTGNLEDILVGMEATVELSTDERFAKSITATSVEPRRRAKKKK